MSWPVRLSHSLDLSQMPWPVRHSRSLALESLLHLWSQMVFEDTVLLLSTVEVELGLHVLDKYSVAQLSFLFTFACNRDWLAALCSNRVGVPVVVGLCLQLASCA